MKHAKKLLALLLVIAMRFALAAPASAKAEGEPTLWEKFTGKLRCTWEEIRIAFLKFLAFLGLYHPPFPWLPPPDEPFDPDDPPVDYKPVIYLYPKQAMEVSVTLKPRGAYFIETIPEYNDGWRVLAQPDGTLTDLIGGGEYPYLFWEAVHEAPWPRLTKGFIVARGDLAGFLEEKLAYMGLIPAEYEEFIEFWLPKLARNEYTLIHFAGKEYEERYPLEIAPAPDSLLRVFMVTKAAKGDERIPPQSLAPFERRGFAAIEWGGMML